MKYSPYPKTYKLKMAERASERKEYCLRNIASLKMVLNCKTQDRKIKQIALINICKERDLLKFLLSL